MKNTRNNPEQIFEILEETGLNWTVHKKPLFGPGGEKTESNGLFTSTGEWISTHGNQYRALQNHEMVDLFLSASEGISKTIRGGSLKKKKLVYLQAKLEDAYVGKSDIKRNLTMMNSFDGSTSIGFGSSSTVVVCSNTFYRAFRDMKKFKHTANAKRNIEIAIRKFRRALKLEIKMIQNFDRMTEYQPKEALLKSVIGRVLNLDLDQDTKDVSTRKKNQLRALSKSIDTEYQLEGHTLWGLFNGITRYTNHEVNTKNRKEYLMSGGGRKANNAAYSEIMEWIEENSHKPILVS